MLNAQRANETMPSVPARSNAGENSVVGPPSTSHRSACWLLPGPFSVTHAMVPSDVASLPGAAASPRKSVAFGSAASHAPPVSEASLVVVQLDVSPSIESVMRFSRPTADPRRQ